MSDLSKTKSKHLVIGASEKPQRYSNMAIKELRANDYETLAVGRREGKVLDVVIETGMPHIEDLDTITLYLNPKNQKEYYDYILSLNPRRVIFNPGTENTELQQKLGKANIIYEEACTLVLLNTKQY